MGLLHNVAPLTLVATLLMVSPRAVAEPSTSERAIAEQLFARARAQLDANEVSAACETFAESQRLDPGTGTALNLAACHQQEGKLASAWVEFRDAIAALHRENRPDRLRFALDHLAELQPKLAFLTLMVPESPRGHAPVVRLDGRELGPPAWSVAIPVDAGWHEAVAQSAGGGLWRATVKVRNGEHRVISIPAHVAAAGITLRDGDDGKPASVLSARATPESGNSEGAPRSRRIAGAVLGGVGVGALGVGGYFALHAASLWRERNQSCAMDICTTDGIRLGERANTAATAATWTLVGGGVAVGSAALLLLWPSSRPSSRPPPTLEAMFVEGKMGLRVGGVF